jgi:hypothetical protein
MQDDILWDDNEETGEKLKVQVKDHWMKFVIK